MARGETSSAPTESTGNAGTRTARTPAATGTRGRTSATANADGANPRSTGAVDTSDNVELTEEDFRKDGTLRVAVQREIAENVPSRGVERSFNEVTGKTTVTTTTGGQAVTFEEDGDTRGRTQRERSTDGAIEAFDRAVEADSEGV